MSWGGSDPAPGSYSTRGAVVPMASEEKNSELAASIALSYLTRIEDQGTIGVEKGSVYGAAVAIPQVGRSAGWPNTMIALSIRSYMYLVINIALQMFLLLMLSKVQHFMTSFNGQMHLCDFGAKIEDCPNGPNCRGPGGTNYTFPRLYNFAPWTTRVFVRDSLKALFPDKADKIDKLVDPGEYGMESYSCRLVCLLIFSMSILDDLRKSVRLAEMLYLVPTASEVWIRYECPAWADKTYAKKLHDHTELNLVKFFVAGMPRKWKIFTGIFVLAPKFYLWCFFVTVGVHMLMETNGILKLILNAMALNFIPQIDEMVFNTLTKGTVKHIMEQIEDFSCYEKEELESVGPEEAKTWYRSEERGAGFGRQFLRAAIMRRPFIVLIITAGFAWKYYSANCERKDDGSYVSTPIKQPISLSFTLWNALVPTSVRHHMKAVWSMPA